MDHGFEVSRLEAVSESIDRLIESRAAEREREEMWKQSERRHYAQRELARRLEWRDHYLRLADVHERRAQENRQKAVRLVGRA